MTGTVPLVGRRAVLSGLGAGAASLYRLDPAAARVLRLPPDLAGEALTLPGGIALGDPRGDVTLIEFFDYNCPFCKSSAADIRPLLAADRRLRYLLINYAILGEASIEASRVALAHAMQRTAGGYLALHEALFRLRGRVDAARAVAASVELGAARSRLIADADSDRVTDILVAAARLGDELGLSATPAFVAGREAVVGYVDLAGKRRAIANLRGCDAISCGPPR